MPTEEEFPLLTEEWFQRIAGRPARYRYWETPDGWQFHYTVERLGDGKYASAIYMPTGKGSRSGRRDRITRLEVRRELHHATRRSARARAYKLYQQHMARRFPPGWQARRMLAAAK